MNMLTEPLVNILPGHFTCTLGHFTRKHFGQVSGEDVVRVTSKDVSLVTSKYVGRVTDEHAD